MEKNINKIIAGIAALAVGLAAIGNVFDFWDVTADSIWWAIGLSALAILSIATTGANVLNIVALCIGVVWFIKKQTFLELTVKEMWTLAWAIVIIIVGLYLIFGNTIKKFKYHKNKNGNGDDEPFRGAYDSRKNPSYIAVFSGGEYANNSKNFSGGSAIAIFGGLDIDISQAEIKRDVELHAVAIFGGVDLFVSPETRVVVNGVSIFGGCDNLANEIIDPKAPTIRLKYVNIFGGTDVKVRINQENPV